MLGGDLRWISLGSPIHLSNLHRRACNSAAGRHRGYGTSVHVWRTESRDYGVHNTKYRNTSSGSPEQRGRVERLREILRMREAETERQRAEGRGLRL